MKGLMDYFRGCCRLTLKGCDPERCLDRFLGAGIGFWKIEKMDSFTLSLTLYQADADLAQALALHCQCDTEIEALPSFRRSFAGLKKRWVLLLGLMGLVAGLFVLPNYIVALEVEGCEITQPEEILRALQTLDVGFGTWGPSIDTDWIQNEMLRLVPELRWIAVNCSGMRANILVAERTPPEPMIDRRESVSNLVACADGIVTELQVMNGQAACAVGDAVVEGQVLISGIVDLERCTMYTRALGEVYAQTRRQITVLTPEVRLERSPEGVAGRCIYLRAGRKRIKIFGSSGIFMGDCVKMIRREAMSLPGGYELPLELWIETYYHTKPQAISLPAPQAEALLLDYVNRWSSEALVAGQVEHQEAELTAEAGSYTLTQTLHCREMIARSAQIPILELEQHGTNDQRGTDGTTD